MNGDYIKGLLEKGERPDNRKMDEFRKIEIETGVAKRAEGSARVKMGKTEVIVGVKLNFGEPYSDSPDAGVLSTGAEFTPIAHPKFESGPPRENAIETARVVDRGIRESGMIDLEKLCIKKGERVWMLFLDIHVINHDGNLIDAASLAAVAALSTTKVPKIKDDKIVRDEFSGDLPVRHKPITISVGKIGEQVVLDATLEEEECLDSQIIIGITEEDKICSTQKRGGSPVSEKDIGKAIDLVVKKSKELRKLI